MSLVRDNAEDYSTHSREAHRCWEVFEDTLIFPPSLEVFLYGWDEECKKERPCSSLHEYARCLVAVTKTTLKLAELEDDDGGDDDWEG